MYYWMYRTTYHWEHTHTIVHTSTVLLLTLGYPFQWSSSSASTACTMLLFFFFFFLLPLSWNSANFC